MHSYTKGIIFMLYLSVIICLTKVKGSSFIEVIIVTVYMFLWCIPIVNSLKPSRIRSEDKTDLVLRGIAAYMLFAWAPGLWWSLKEFLRGGLLGIG